MYDAQLQLGHENRKIYWRELRWRSGFAPFWLPTLVHMPQASNTTSKQRMALIFQQIQMLALVLLLEGTVADWEAQKQLFLQTYRGALQQYGWFHLLLPRTVQSRSVYIGTVIRVWM